MEVRGGVGGVDGAPSPRADGVKFLPISSATQEHKLIRKRLPEVFKLEALSIMAICNHIIMLIISFCAVQWPL